MEPAESSGASTPPEREPVMDCCLVLTTLSGVTFNVSLSIAKFDRFADLEDHVMDYLVSVTDLKVFGCSIEFLHLATQTYLEDPIWDRLQQSMEYCIIFKDCSEVLPSQELLEGYPIHKVPLAVHVPMNPERSVPEGAFAGVPRLRHVECCSLQWVYTTEGIANRFSSSTKFGHYLFRGCVNLAEFTLQESPSPSELPSQPTASELALGCLSSTGIATLTLTQGFKVIGAHACDNCHLLKNVDLSNTQIEEMQEFTFVHCTSLKEVRLPRTLHTIRVKAFMNCAALPELAIPPSLKYIASRAFLDCTAFKRLVKLPGRRKWRGVYAEENAFAICPDMRWPPWLHMIPDTGYVSGLA